VRRERVLSMSGHLKYQNRRADYVSAWFNVINWDFVADRYSKREA
jgi:Fe-Mn family superoxide dismutase